MNAADFRAAINQLGMTQRGTARFFKRTTTTVLRWAKDGSPEEIDLWLRFMLGVQADMHIKDVPAWVYLMAGRELEKPRKARKIAP